MEFFYAFGGFFFPFGILLLGVVVLAVAAVVGRRAAPDPMGRRPFAIYLLSVMFITLLTTAWAVAQIGGSLAEKVAGKEPPFVEIRDIRGTIEIPPPAELVAAEGFQAASDGSLVRILEPGLVGLLAAAIFEFHRRRWNVILRAEAKHG